MNSKTQSTQQYTHSDLSALNLYPLHVSHTPTHELLASLSGSISYTTIACMVYLLCGKEKPGRWSTVILSPNFWVLMHRAYSPIYMVLWYTMDAILSETNCIWNCSVFYHKSTSLCRLWSNIYVLDLHCVTRKSAQRNRISTSF